MKSTVTSKGQTTIPKSIRDRLHLNQGAEIDWNVEDDGSTLTVRLAAAQENPFQALVGAFPLPAGMDVADVMQDIRGERDPLLTQGMGARVVSIEDFLRQANRPG